MVKCFCEKFVKKHFAAAHFVFPTSASGVREKVSSTKRLGKRFAKFASPNLKRRVFARNFLCAEIGFTILHAAILAVSAKLCHRIVSRAPFGLSSLLGRNISRNGAMILHFSFDVHFPRMADEYVSNTYRDFAAPCVICLFSVRLYRGANAFTRRSQNFQAAAAFHGGRKAMEMSST